MSGTTIRRTGSYSLLPTRQLIPFVLPPRMSYPLLIVPLPVVSALTDSYWCSIGLLPPVLHVARSKASHHAHFHPLSGVLLSTNSFRIYPLVLLFPGVVCYIEGKAPMSHHPVPEVQTPITRPLGIFLSLRTSCCERRRLTSPLNQLNPCK